MRSLYSSPTAEAPVVVCTYFVLIYFGVPLKKTAEVIFFFSQVMAFVKDRVQTCLSEMGMKEYPRQNSLLEDPDALTPAAHLTTSIQRL